jgi:uncharacterized membrane protein
MKKRSITFLYLSLLLFVSGGLLFLAASQKSFWEDEAFTAIFSQQSPAELFKGLAWDVHPPFYLFLAGQWGRVFGFNEIGLRSFSILAALIALLLTYKLAKDLLGERIGLISVTLLAFYPLFVMYGHNARYYSLAMVFALLSAWSTYRFTSLRSSFFLVLYVLSGVGFLYLLFAAVSVLAVCNLWWLVRWIKIKHNKLILLILWILAQAAIIGSYIPGLRAMAGVTGRFSQLAEVGNWLVEILKRLGYYGFVSAVGETISPLNPIAWVGIILVIGLAALAVIKSWRNFNFWMPVLFFSIITLANLAVTFNTAVSQTWQNLTYRALYAYPFLMIWLGVGFSQLKGRWAWLVGAALGVLLITTNVNYFTNHQFMRPIYTVPWKAIFTRIQNERLPDSTVICGSGDTSCFYYAGQFGFPQNNSADAVNSQSASEVWFIRTNLGREDASSEQVKAQNDFLSKLAQLYPHSTIYNYAPQSPSIRWLKSKLLNQEDYEYRVNLIQLSR